MLLVVAVVGGVLVGAAPGATARPSDPTRPCVTHAPAGRGDRIRDEMPAPAGNPLGRWIADHRAAAADSAVRAGRRTVTIPVYFHVIRKNLTVAGGNIPSSWITAQMKVLNDSFAGRTGGVDTGFRFDLKRISRTTKAGWFNLTGYGQDCAMKSALRVGGPRTLNVYSARLGAQLLGYAY